MRNKRILHEIVLGIVLVSGTISCTHSRSILVTPTVSFSQSIVPIFTSSCNYGTGCHAQATGANLNICLDTPGVYANLFSKQLINTATPQASMLYAQVSSGVMPKAPYPAITTAQQNLILNWIKQGANNN